MATLNNSHNNESDKSSDNRFVRLQPGSSSQKVIKKSKPGIIYFGSVPYGMNITGIKHYFEKYGNISNIFFQIANRDNCEYIFVNNIINCACRNKLAFIENF